MNQAQFYKAQRIRAQRYVTNRLKGKSMRQSALDAGYPETTANNAGSLIEGQPGIAKALQAHLAELCPNDRLAQRLSEGLDATKEGFQGTVLVDYKERREHVKLIAQLTEQMEVNAPVQQQINMNIINVGS